MDKKSMIQSGVYGLILGFMVLVHYSGVVAHSYSEVEVPLLNTNCPPGFKLNANNECEGPKSLRSL